MKLKSIVFGGLGFFCVWGFFVVVFILLYLHLDFFFFSKRVGDLNVLHKYFVFPFWNKLLAPCIFFWQAEALTIFAIFLSRYLRIGILFQSLSIPQFLVLIAFSFTDAPVVMKAFKKSKETFQWVSFSETEISAEGSVCFFTSCSLMFTT